MRCAVEGLTAAGVPWANVFWVTCTSGTTPTVAQCNTFAQDFYAAFSTHFWVLQGKDATLKRCIVNFYGVSPVQIAGEYSTDTAGGSADNTEVDSLAAVVSWTFGATWRGGKPRTYMAALPTNAFATTNTISSTYMTALDTAAAAFITAVAAIAVTNFTSPHLVVMSFFSGNVGRTPPEAFTITAGTARPRICSQRRRLGKETP